MSAIPQCIETAPEPSQRICPYCESSFFPRKPWQAFCSSAHRTAYDMEHGTRGQVASVRKLKNGVSVVLRLEGPAAERALNLGIGQIVRIVSKL